MAQFDIYEYSSPSTSYLVDLQDDVINDLSTRIAAPLVPIEDVPRQMKILNPIVRVDEADFLLMTHLLAAIPASALVAVPVPWTQVWLMQPDDFLANFGGFPGAI